ncbi:hypothetical protein VCRA2133E348_70070 [Vibrio crassostreae]|nr:hypothetical protein VCRA2133E348_70070 [Vibrio crassostreae]
MSFITLTEMLPISFVFPANKKVQKTKTKRLKNTVLNEGVFFFKIINAKKYEKI